MQEVGWVARSNDVLEDAVLLGYKRMSAGRKIDHNIKNLFTST